jgi:hypothetical protein
MNILFLHEGLRSGGVDFLRSRYLVEDLEERGHDVKLASFITDQDPEAFEERLKNDVISIDEVMAYRPDVLLISRRTE